MEFDDSFDELQVEQSESQPELLSSPPNLVMDQGRADSLRDAFFKICMKLQNVELVCEYMISNGCLTDEQLQEVTKHTQAFLKNYELLRSVECGANRTYDCFRKALIKVEETDVANFLPNFDEAQFL